MENAVLVSPHKKGRSNLNDFELTMSPVVSQGRSKPSSPIKLTKVKKLKAKEPSIVSKSSFAKLGIIQPGKAYLGARNKDGGRYTIIKNNQVSISQRLKYCLSPYDALKKSIIQGGGDLYGSSSVQLSRQQGF